jgi:hypothetical protein
MVGIRQRFKEFTATAICSSAGIATAAPRIPQGLNSGYIVLDRSIYIVYIKKVCSTYHDHR